MRRPNSSLNHLINSEGMVRHAVVSLSYRHEPYQVSAADPAYILYMIQFFLTSRALLQLRVTRTPPLPL